MTKTELSQSLQPKFTHRQMSSFKTYFLCMILSLAFPIFGIAQDGDTISTQEGSGPESSATEMKLPVFFFLEGFSVAMGAFTYFDWGRYYSGAVTAGFGGMLIVPNLNTEYYSGYQDLGQRIAATSTGILLVGLSGYLFTLNEPDPQKRMLNTFLGCQLAVLPIIIKVLTSDKIK